MISIIVYGRNDDHGYNLHRRVALSLNCLAEVLTDDDDEIVFVDYNTPDQLPTLVEALADTLTVRCLSALRVIRVRERTHVRLFAGRTHLPIVEPVARNVGARHANPANRWLLSTNTDMILVPLEDESLSEICDRLPDGFYALPRFELPEWLWEQLPRTDPSRVLADVGHLGPTLQLGETVTSHEEIRFDAPGDFQLVLREEFFAIDGFDEEMVLGWHVDSNLSKRLLLRRGSIESLEDHIAGYHCNHQRTLTVYHDTGLANDLGRFFREVEVVALPRQRGTWGLADEELEVVPVGDVPDRQFISAVLTASGDPGASRRGSFDALSEKFALEYDSRHVLPFVTDAIRTGPRDPVVGYLGTNTDLARMLATTIAALTRGRLEVVEPGDRDALSRMASHADLVIVDLGVDASRFDAPLATGFSVGLAHARTELIRVLHAFTRLVDLERMRLEHDRWHRPFVLVNSSAVFWRPFVVANMNVSSTTPHSRVRNAVVKLEPDRSAEAVAYERRAAQLIRWMTRRDSGTTRLTIRRGECIELFEHVDYAGFGKGWEFPDRLGVWTSGPRSELSIHVEGMRSPAELILAFDDIGTPPRTPVRIAALIAGTTVATTTFGRKPHRPRARARRTHRLPRRALRRVLRAGARLARAARVPGVDRSIAWVRRLGQTETEHRHFWTLAVPGDQFPSGALDLELALESPAGSQNEDPRVHLRSITIEEG